MNDGHSTTHASPRDAIKEMAEEYGVDADHLLIQSKRRDPMWKGTDADHAKAEWFARWWRQAVDGREDARIHVRGVHYYMVSEADDIEPPTNCSWDVYANTTRCYKYLEEASVLARILGYMPLGGLTDQKHDQFVVTHYREHRTTADTGEAPLPTGVETPPIPQPDDRAETLFDLHPWGWEGEASGDEVRAGVEAFADFAAGNLADELVDQLYFDRPRQAPYHLELWSEKSLPDYIKTVAQDYGINVVVEGEGDLSLTIAHDLVQRIEETGKPAIIFYLSDFDPKGDNMASAMSGKLAWLNQRGDVSQRVVIEQLAVTLEQVRELGLPRKPIEESSHTGTGGVAYDTLVSDWEQRRGAGATELNALEARPEEFQRIVREGLAPYVDDEVPEKTIEAVKQWQDDVREAVRETATDDDSPLGEAIADLATWIEEFNAALDDAEPVLRDLREQHDSDYYRKWKSAVRDTIEAADLPTATAPIGEASLPDSPLYDSERGYAENVAHIDKYKSGVVEP